MKRYFAITISLVFIFLLWGCDNTKHTDDAPIQELYYYGNFIFKEDTILTIEHGKPVGHPTSLFSCEANIDGKVYPISFLSAIIAEELHILPPSDNSLIVQPIGKNLDVVLISVCTGYQDNYYHYLGNLFEEALTPIGPETELNIKELSVSPDLSKAVAILGKNEAISYYDGQKWTNLDISGENIGSLFLEDGTCLITSIEAISEASHIPPKDYITLYHLNCTTGVLEKTAYERVLLSDEGFTLYGSRYATDASGEYLTIVDISSQTEQTLPIATKDIKNISASRELFIVYLKSGQLYAVKKSTGQILAIGNAPDPKADSYNQVLSSDGHIYLTHSVLCDDGTTQNAIYRLTPDMPGEALTQYDLSWFNEEFFSNERINAEGNVIFNIRNMFLACEYNSPEEIDLGVVFRQGLGSYSDVTQEEIELYCKVTGKNSGLDFSKITLVEMSDIFYENTGMHLSQTLKVGLDKLVYLEEYEAFYHCHGDTAYSLYRIEAGQRATDGTVTLYYRRFPFEDSSLYKVTLKPAEGTYHFISNLPAE